MQRIIISLVLITITGGALTFGATRAFFSDTESSVGNIFTAGAIDLKVDNESYYNGVATSTTSWEAKDLTIEKFFNFMDLKPDDYGEDTISLHVDTNDAYLCANVKLTSNNDNTQNEPEALVDANGTTTGELAALVNFIWWADDGDNVFENNEKVISKGPIGALGVGGSTTIALADSSTNIWTGQGGSIPGGVTQYIGKAWCFGTIGTTTIVQDGGDLGRSPAGNNNGDGLSGTPEDGGITCNGEALGNESQTDSLTADVTFTAMQARNVKNFLCVPPVVRPEGKIVVTKIVVNNDGGNNVVSDFNLLVDDGLVSIPVVSGVTSTVPAGTYSVAETGVSGYEATFGGDCDVDGNVTVVNGQTKYCIITNDDLRANITLIKNVINNNGGTAVGTSFKMRVDGTLVPTGGSKLVTSNANHTISEDAFSGYSFVSITGAGCPATLPGIVVLNEGQAITCTITNDDNAPI